MSDTSAVVQSNDLSGYFSSERVAEGEDRFFRVQTSSRGYFGIFDNQTKTLIVPCSYRGIRMIGEGGVFWGVLSPERDGSSFGVYNSRSASLIIPDGFLSTVSVHVGLEKESLFLIGTVPHPNHNWVVVYNVQEKVMHCDSKALECFSFPLDTKIVPVEGLILQVRGGQAKLGIQDHMYMTPCSRYLIINSTAGSCKCLMLDLSKGEIIRNIALNP